MTATHLIRKQVLDIELASANGSFLLQQQLSALYRHQISPMLDELLSEFCDDDEIICIEKLAIDLGEIDPSQLALAFVGRARKLLKAALIETLTSNKGNNVSRQNLQQRSLKLIEHYCRQGHLPWWGQKYDIASQLGLQMKQQPTELVATLVPLLARHHHSAQRLLNLLSPSEGFALVALLQRCSADEAVQYYHRLARQVKATKITVPVERISLLSCWLQYSITGSTPNTASTSSDIIGIAAAFIHQHRPQPIPLQRPIANTTPLPGATSPQLANVLERTTTINQTGLLRDLARIHLSDEQQRTLRQQLEQFIQYQPESAKRLLLQLLNIEQLVRLTQWLQLLDGRQLYQWLDNLPGVQLTGADHQQALDQLATLTMRSANSDTTSTNTTNTDTNRQIARSQRWSKPQLTDSQQQTLYKQLKQLSQHNPALARQWLLKLSKNQHIDGQPTARDKERAAGQTGTGQLKPSKGQYIEGHRTQSGKERSAEQADVGQVRVQTSAQSSVQQSAGEPVYSSVAQGGDVFSQYDATGQDQAHYISNSGLVMLWPFWATFFERLGLLQNKQLQNKQLQDKPFTDPQQAVLLLHYLAHTTAPQSEHDLLFNKLLCGVSPNLPIALNIEIAVEQQQAIDELLAAVIGHWSSLGNVSVNWLRQLFLQRNGVLKYKDNHWLLQIEGAAADVLLKKLPWGISTIKLPWLDNLITIEWRY